MTETRPLAITLSTLRRRLSRHSLSVEEAARIASEAAGLIRARRLDNGLIRDSVSLLGELTVCGSRPIEEAATRILFRDVIEPLNDSFDGDQAEVADQVTAQLIDIHRLADSRLDVELSAGDIGTEPEVLARRLRAAHRIPENQERVKRIFVLSRITVGADVAVTSVILDHLRHTFPTRDLVLVGPRKLRQLFGGDERLLFQTVEFQRTALLRDRFGVWISLQRAIEEGIKPLEDGEYLVVDPDSRMTQLGLLPPIAGESSYFLFDSRRVASASSKSLAEIASEWCAARWPVEEGWKARPFVAPVMENDVGRDLLALVDGQGRRKVTFVSLGVGGNTRKRLSFELETALIEGLAARTALIIDSGATEEERSQVTRVASRLGKQGVRVIRASESSVGLSQLSEAEVLLWDGGIGSFARLISECDAYVGYDSAGQHIAAALGRPVLTLFAVGESELFSQRWRANGRGPTRTLLFNATDDRNSTELIDRAMKLFSELSERSKRTIESRP